YVKRVIGTSRREYLDHVIVLGEASFYRHLKAFATYYHESRTHLSLAKDTPEERSVQPPELGTVIAIPRVGGLHLWFSKNHKPGESTTSMLILNLPRSSVNWIVGF